MTSGLNVLLGAANFGYKPSASGVQVTSDKSLIESILQLYKENGYNQIDTARTYGDGTSEQILSAVDYATRGFILDTKIRSYFPGAHQKELVIKSFRESLQALNAEKVNILYLHSPDRQTPFLETLEAINELHAQRSFEKFGLSNYRPEEVEQIVQICSERGFVKPSVYQGMYNIVSRGIEKDLFPVLRRHKISFYAYSPLGGGFLTEYMSRDTKSVRFDPSLRIGEKYNKYYFQSNRFEALEKLREVGQAHELSVPEIALRWLVHHSHLKQEYGDAVILGGSSLARIAANLGFVGKPALPQDFDAVFEFIKESVPDSDPYAF